MRAVTALLVVATPESGKRAVLEVHADVAHAGYGDSIGAARELRSVSKALLQVG